MNRYRVSVVGRVLPSGFISRGEAVPIVLSSRHLPCSLTLTLPPTTTLHDIECW